MALRRRRADEDDSFFISFTDAVSALLGISILILTAVLTFFYVDGSERDKRYQDDQLQRTNEIKQLNLELKEERQRFQQLKKKIYGVSGGGNGEGGLLPSLEIQGDTLFSSGSSTLTREGQTALRALAAEVRKHPRFTSDTTSIVVVQGFTDDEGVGLRSGYRSNWHLSADRAAVVTEQLIKFGDLPPDRVAAAGFSQYYPRPANPVWTEKQRRAHNRYVKLVLISRATLLEEPQPTNPE